MAATTLLEVLNTPYPPELIPPPTLNTTPIIAIQGDTFKADLDGIGWRGYDWKGNGTTTGLKLASCLAV